MELSIEMQHVWFPMTTIVLEFHDLNLSKFGVLLFFEFVPYIVFKNFEHIKCTCCYPLLLLLLLLNLFFCTSDAFNAHVMFLRIFICCLMVHLYWTFVCMNVVLLLIMATMWVVQWNVSRVEWKKIDYYFVFQDDGNDHPSTQWLRVICGSLSINVVHVRWEVRPWIVGCKV